jgi:hypothetical protein
MVLAMSSRSSAPLNTMAQTLPSGHLWGSISPMMLILSAKMEQSECVVLMAAQVYARAVAAISRCGSCVPPVPTTQAGALTATLSMRMRALLHQCGGVCRLRVEHSAILFVLEEIVTTHSRQPLLFPRSRSRSTTIYQTPASYRPRG